MRNAPLLSILLVINNERSITKSIQHGYAKDLQRAQKILQVELDKQSSDEEELASPEGLVQGKLKIKTPVKRSEVSFDSQLINLKSDRFISMLDRSMGNHKKRTFNKRDVRCLQSRINLKFPIKDMLKDKTREHIHLKEGT